VHVRHQSEYLLDCLTNAFPKRGAREFSFNAFGGRLSWHPRDIPSSRLLLSPLQKTLRKRPKTGLTGLPPDISLGASVQNILKKVKKRLVSSLKRR
jgi:hypothetical protein